MLGACFGKGDWWVRGGEGVLPREGWGNGLLRAAELWCMNCMLQCVLVGKCRETDRERGEHAS